VVITPDGLRKLAYAPTTVIKGDDIVGAADAWEKVEEELRLTSEMGARLNADSLAYEARIEELEKALRDILDGMEASGGWEGDDEAFTAGMSALKGKPCLSK